MDLGGPARLAAFEVGHSELPRQVFTVRLAFERLF